MRVRREAASYIGAVAVIGLGAMLGFAPVSFGVGFIVAGTALFLFFFRDPHRSPPADPDAILSGADGRVMSVRRLIEPVYLRTECVRISVFLSIFDVHVNRSPLAGRCRFAGHFPGKKLFAFREKSSEVNQHNKIVIEGAGATCIMIQIVGPVARRVVYWLDPDASVPVEAGERIGMMKFGSRLDVYLPAKDVDVLVNPSDRVRAGETIIARLKQKDPSNRVSSSN